MFSLAEAAGLFNQALRTQQEVGIKSYPVSAPKAHREVLGYGEEAGLLSLSGRTSGHWSHLSPVLTAPLPRHSSGALTVSWDAPAFPALASLQLMGRVGGGLDCPAADAVWGDSPRVLRLETSEAEGD